MLLCLGGPAPELAQYRRFFFLASFNRSMAESIAFRASILWAFLIEQHGSCTQQCISHNIFMGALDVGFPTFAPESNIFRTILALQNPGSQRLKCNMWIRTDLKRSSDGKWPCASL